MATIDVLDASGTSSGSTELPDAVFGIEPHGPVTHQVVTAQRAARRAGTQATKTRAEVAGGGAKPWGQKGTGRARQGSIRSPQWRGGGVALGPKPRDHAQRTPKKMVRLALASALSDRASEDRIRVIDWGIDEPGTRRARQTLEALEITGRVLAVVSDPDGPVARSLRNLTTVAITTSAQLVAYDVLVADWVIFEDGTVPSGGDPAQLPGRAARDTAVDGEAQSEARNDDAANVTDPS